MDLEFIKDYYMPIVLVGCLVVGYILKAWIKDLDNKYIPTILAMLGATLGCIAVKTISLENIIYGAVTGLASTGLHQAFTKIINSNNTKI